LEPTSSRIVSLWKDEGPAAVRRHQPPSDPGAVDVESLRWDESTLSLSGVSHVVQNDPYRVRFYVPKVSEYSQKASRKKNSLPNW
jgi:hypothetical protein